MVRFLLKIVVLVGVYFFQIDGQRIRFSTHDWSNSHMLQLVRLLPSLVIANFGYLLRYEDSTW